jgi:hypothetical protein
MINLKTFFKNHFDTKEISDDKMKKFTEVHLQMLISNNAGGEFDTLIADTTNAYQTYYGSISDEGARFALQQALTKAMNNTVEAFKKAASQKEGIIRGTFGKDAPAYQEFFPFGVGEYTHANLADIERLMDQFLTAANAHVAEVGIPFVTEFQNYKSAYISAREAQLLKKAEVTDLKTASTAKRDVVEIQLMKNLYTVAAMYVGNEDKCMDFFDQSFIRNGSNGGDDEEPTPPTP